MSPYVLDLRAVVPPPVRDVGGKGASLAVLASIEGVDVPEAFCVTTAVFDRIVLETPALRDPLDRLAALGPGDRDAIRAVTASLREILETVVIPPDVEAAVTGALAALGTSVPCAVRSSATAEDLPTASFAGQHDTFLDVVGPAAVLDAVRRCWASLYSERAVTYRIRGGFDHRNVRMAVVVQRMVPADAAGVLFTADPVSGHRRVAVVEACLGLGEALVSGRVDAYVARVRDGVVSPERQAQAALTDEQVLRLVALGRRVEAHVGRPQDIEWCLLDGEFRLVQARAITTLFPVPPVTDGENHVYVSVGHQQMMTDVMRPLGLSLWRLTSRAPMQEAGGRLFVDVTRGLASPVTRAGILTALGRSDPRIRDALETVLARDFLRLDPPSDSAPGAPPPGPPPLDADPAIPARLVARTEASLAALRMAIEGKRGAELLRFLREDIEELRRLMADPESYRVIMAGIEATWWLNEHVERWLGDKNVADTLTQSVAGNVTSEMGLALLDVADVLRPHPPVVAFLASGPGEDFVDALPAFDGGLAAQGAIRGFLDRYGARGVGEIDVTRPRFAERPTMLIPVLLGHVRNVQPGEALRRFERGERAAGDKADEVLVRLRALPDGEAKAAETRRVIDRLRAFIGYREFPKFGMIRRYFLYKQALWAEAGRLVAAGILADVDDIGLLTIPELEEVVRTQVVDPGLLRERREALRAYQGLTPPRVLTSDGEGLSGAFVREDVPAGALLGLAVSAGTVEGRARVVASITEAVLEAGDILVTAYTDPSWTPLFVGIAGLVTEVGGLMTHGAVIAREYGLPAVVGVEGATRLIRDGQRIRVHGTDGYVEVIG